jgi:hypothetical protein
VAHCAHSGCHRRRPSLLVRLAGLGLRLNGDWYCSAACLDASARERLARSLRPVPGARPAAATLRLGVLLAHQVGLPPEALTRGLEAQKKSRLRLGAQLVKQGAVSEHEVLRALAAQAGIGFLTSVDPMRPVVVPPNMTADAVRALGLVPLAVDAKNEVVRVACAAPVPRLAMAAMRELTGYRIEPYLVADRLFGDVLEAWCARQPSPGRAGRVAGDVPSAAARIVAAARAKGGAQLTEALCNDRVWLRLEADGQTEDLWVHARP